MHAPSGHLALPFFDAVHRELAARLTPSMSPAPLWRPTRTPPAMASPSGIMKAVAAFEIHMLTAAHAMRNPNTMRRLL